MCKHLIYNYLYIKKTAFTKSNVLNEKFEIFPLLNYVVPNLIGFTSIS